MRNAKVLSGSAKSQTPLQEFLDGKQQVADLRSKVLTNLLKMRGVTSVKIGPIPLRDGSHTMVIALGDGERIEIIACYDPVSRGTFLNVDLGKFSSELMSLEALQGKRMKALGI